MKKIFVILLVSLGMVSCKKFLAEQSQSDVIPRKTSDFGEILYSNGYPTNTTFLQPYLNLMDDDIEAYNSEAAAQFEYLIKAAGAAYQWQPEFIVLAEQQGDPQVTRYNSWRQYYKLILGANVAIQYMDNSVGSQNDKNQYKGEAYALRAFYHFMLVNLYSKPYNDSTTSPDQSRGVPVMRSASLSDDLPSTSSVKEVYAQVTSDLDSALGLLDQVKTNVPLYRISSIATHLLASRVYLYMEQWDKAVEHASQVIKIHPQLMDLNGWGDPDPNNKPIIGYGNIETLWYYGNPEEGEPSGIGSCFDISGDLAACFSANDLRSQVYFNIIPDFLRPYVAVPYSFQKLYASLAPVNGVYLMGTAFRSSEAYLNRAEANIQLYKTKGDAAAATAALNDLNALRANRIERSSFINWDLAPADTLLQRCRTERRRELFREGGHRWFDLRRYGMPSIRHINRPTTTTEEVYRLTARDPQYVIPIPRDVLERNPSLQQSTQLPALRKPE